LQSYILLFAVINPEKFENWCKQNNVLADEATLQMNDNLIKEVYSDIKRLGKEFNLNGLEIPKGIKLLKEPFSIENGLLTATMKFRRNVARKLYQETID